MRGEWNNELSLEVGKGVIDSCTHRSGWPLVEDKAAGRCTAAGRERTGRDHTATLDGATTQHSLR